MAADTMWSPDEFLGQVLGGSYRILRLMAKGGMGAIYEAEHVRLPSLRCAVKVLQPRWMVERDKLAMYFARFQREAELLSGLQHPNIVRILDFNKTDEDSPYLVMELLEGENLESRLKRTGRLRPDIVREIVLSVGGALSFIHFRGVIHRDLKPANIFLAAAPGGLRQIKLLDFGISKDLENPQVLTHLSHAVMGTAMFMAPEQARGDIQEVDHRSDIFALATTIYCCLSGVHPFDAEDDTTVRRNICFARAVPVSTLAPGLPVEIDAVIGRAHAKHKTDRYAAVEDFVNALAALLPAERPPEAMSAPHVSVRESTIILPQEVGTEERETLPTTSAELVSIHELSTEPPPTPDSGLAVPVTESDILAGVSLSAAPLSAAPSRRPSWLMIGLGGGVLLVAFFIVWALSTWDTGTVPDEVAAVTPSPPLVLDTRVRPPDAAVPEEGTTKLRLARSPARTKAVPAKPVLPRDGKKSPAAKRSNNQKPSGRSRQLLLYDEP